MPLQFSDKYFRNIEKASDLEKKKERLKQDAEEATNPTAKKRLRAEYQKAKRDYIDFIAKKNLL